MNKNRMYAAFAALVLTVACGRPALPPVCDYDRAPSETLEEQRLRLGPTVGTMCRELIPGHNDVRTARVNLVFVNVGYGAVDFVQRVEDSIDCDGTHDGLLTVEPFRSNLDNFNFWVNPASGRLSEALETELGQEFIEPGLELARACALPNRTIYVMANSDFRAASSRPVFNGIHFEQMDLTNLEYHQQQLANLNTGYCQGVVNLRCGQTDLQPDEQMICSAIEDLRGEQDPRLDAEICGFISERNTLLGMSRIGRGADASVVVHETGHQLLAINDEYTEEDFVLARWEEYGSHLDLTSHNCFRATTQASCERDAPWGGECHQGCGFVNQFDGVPVWRQMEDGIMQSNTRYLGEWNELRACQVIDVITHNAHGYCERFGFQAQHSVLALDVTLPNRVRTRDLEAHEEFLRTSISLP